MKKLNSYLAQKQEYLSKEMSSSNFIPYSLHCNEDTVLLKDNSLLKIIKDKRYMLRNKHEVIILDFYLLL